MNNHPYSKCAFDDQEFLTFDDRKYQYITSADFYQAGFDDVYSKVKNSISDIQKKKDLPQVSYRKQGLFSKAYYELCKLMKLGEKSKGNPEKEKEFIDETKNYYLDEFQKEEWKLYEKDYELVPDFNSVNKQLEKDIQEESCQAVIDMVANNTNLTVADLESQPSQEEKKEAPKKSNVGKYAVGGVVIFLLINFLGGNDAQ